MKKAKWIALCAVAGVMGCVAPVEECPVRWRYADQFGYAVQPTLETPSGISVDPSGQAVDLAVVEGIVDDVESCLQKEFGDPPRIPDDVRAAANCYSSTFPAPYPRAQCLTIKIPNDWVLSCDKSQQVLPWEAPEAGCLAKGLTPTKVCPCRWRAGIQDNDTAVTTPNLYNLRDPLIRIITGCNSPWSHPRLAKCATPSTDMRYGE